MEGGPASGDCQAPGTGGHIVICLSRSSERWAWMASEQGLGWISEDVPLAWVDG
jgi:hypothetical protein